MLAEQVDYVVGVDTHRDQQVHRPLFEDTRPDAIDHIVAAAVFDDDRVDAVEVQQLREEQPCGTSTDDSNLRLISMRH